MAQRVLVVTGGFLHAGERSAWRALRRQAGHWRHAGSTWFDFKVKLVTAEPILLCRQEARRAPPEVRAFLAHDPGDEPPELTEVLLATLLAAEGAEYDLLTVDELLDGSRRARGLVDGASCVFLSSTMLRDLSEVEALVRRLRRPQGRLVVGGALAGAILPSFEGLEGVDVLAVGDGERLVPALCAWLRAGEGVETLRPPLGGSVETRGPTTVLRAGAPPGLSLDAYPTPDWARSARDRRRRYRTVHYESARGCPYRCGFCNYPYLFDDRKFRTRSAARIADDWERHARETGAEHVNCLDSLFTMPRARLVELCEELVRRDLRLGWTCYARADDLADADVVRLMRRAGARLVHVGIESGDQGQLDRMDKRCTVAANARALDNCRREGVTTFATLVIGYPGETEETLGETHRFLRRTPPDFHFLAVFNARIEGVPVLREESRARFGLATETNPRTTAPYWRHDTMDCVEATAHQRRLEERLAEEEVSLNAAVFYRSMLAYRPALRPALLRFQRDARRRHPVARALLGAADAWAGRRARRALRRGAASRLPPARAREAAP